jgi:predicted metal-dependent hydrolase
MTHTYLGNEIDFAITYKRCKNIRIKIDGYGRIEVEAPKETPTQYIIEILESKWDWILNKSKEMKLRAKGTNDKVYENEEHLLYLGKSYPILISEDINIQKDYVTFEEDTLHLYVKQKDEEGIRQVLKRFYYQQCKILVNKSLKKYQSYFKLKPGTISISDNNKTWGTCDSKRNFTFHWKLAMAPLEVIDYVVVHEMCHMEHMNHDRSFWRLVGKIMPDYENKQDWLAHSNWKMTI